MGRDPAVEPERLERAAHKMSEACDKASESRHHLERVADHLEKLVEVWKTGPASEPDSH